MLYILFHEQDRYAQDYLHVGDRWSAATVLNSWKIKKDASGYGDCYDCPEGTDFKYFKIDVSGYHSRNAVIYMGHGFKGGYGPKKIVGNITRKVISAGLHVQMMATGAKLFAKIVLSICSPNAIMMMTCHALKWVQDEKSVLIEEGMPRIDIYATKDEFSNMMMPVLIKPFLSGDYVSLDCVRL